jgi:hypothetical protein
LQGWLDGQSKQIEMIEDVIRTKEEVETQAY